MVYGGIFVNTVVFLRPLVHMKFLEIDVEPSVLALFLSYSRRQAEYGFREHGFEH